MTKRMQTIVDMLNSSEDDTVRFGVLYYNRLKADQKVEVHKQLKATLTMNSINYKTIWNTYTSNTRLESYRHDIPSNDKTHTFLTISCKYYER